MEGTGGDRANRERIEMEERQDTVTICWGGNTDRERAGCM